MHSCVTHRHLSQGRGGGGADDHAKGRAAHHRRAGGVRASERNRRRRDAGVPVRAGPPLGRVLHLSDRCGRGSFLLNS